MLPLGAHRGSATPLKTVSEIRRQHPRELPLDGLLLRVERRRGHDPFQFFVPAELGEGLLVGQRRFAEGGGLGGEDRGLQCVSMPIEERN